MSDKKRNRYFVPKFSEPSSRKYYTVDIESNDWTKFEMLAFYDGKKREKKVFESISQFLDTVLTKKYRSAWFYGHYAGKFDWLFVLEELDKSFRCDGFTYKIINQGSRIIQLRVKKDKHCWYFVDSASLFPNTKLEALCNTFVTNTRKMVGTIDFENGEKVSKDNLLHREYMVTDAVALYEVIEKYLENEKVRKEGLNLTLASTAMGMFRRTMTSPVHISPQFSADFVRRGYVGGRVEIFKLQGSGLQYYDVNSLFPYCMRNFPMPLEFDSVTDEFCDDSFGFFDVTVEAPDSYIPVLPFKTETRLIFPTGRFRGVYFSEELKLAVEQGYKILEVHEGHLYTQCSDFFASYIDYWYEVKKRAAKGSPEEFLAKLYLNSLYGKFGQSETRETLQTFEDNPNVDNYKVFHSTELFESKGLITVESSRRSPHMLPHISAAVTAYSRMHMCREIYLPNPEALHYTDTDSGLTRERLPTGIEIGELKLESKKIKHEGQEKVFVMEDCEGTFLRPKGYEISKNGIVLDRKMKGFPTKFIKGLTSREFKESSYVYRERRIASMKRALISNKSFLAIENIEKRILNDYNKRRVLRGGNTEPWVLRDDEILNKTSTKEMKKVCSSLI